MSGLRAERGEFSLIGIVVAMSLFLAVMAATLNVFDIGQRDTRNLAESADAQDHARVAIDLLTRQLRNLASPTPQQPQAIDAAGDTNLIFQTVDPNGPNSGANSANVKRVRWCLGSDRKLYLQTQTWTTSTVPAAPTDTACPGTSWPVQSAWGNRNYRVISDDINNIAGGQTRPIFTYNAPTSQLTSITEIHVRLLTRTSPTGGPAELSLSSGVYLRNQNRAPVASFTYQSNGGAVLFNASDSYDPEEEPLAGYCWYDTTGGVPTVTSPPSPCDAGPLVGTGLTFSYNIAHGTTRQIQLVVKDPEGLTGTSTQAVSN